MGITFSRNMREKSVARNFNAAYFPPKTGMSQLLDRDGSEIGVEGGIKADQGSFFNLQRILVKNVFEDFRESEWTFLL